MAADGPRAAGTSFWLPLGLSSFAPLLVVSARHNKNALAESLQSHFRGQQLDADAQTQGSFLGSRGGPGSRLAVAAEPAAGQRQGFGEGLGSFPPQIPQGRLLTSLREKPEAWLHDKGVAGLGKQRFPSRGGWVALGLQDPLIMKTKGGTGCGWNDLQLGSTLQTQISDTGAGCLSAGAPGLSEASGWRRLPKGLVRSRQAPSSPAFDGLRRDHSHGSPAGPIGYPGHPESRPLRLPLAQSWVSGVMPSFHQADSVRGTRHHGLVERHSRTRFHPLHRRPGDKPGRQISFPAVQGKWAATPAELWSEEIPPAVGGHPRRGGWCVSLAVGMAAWKATGLSPDSAPGRTGCQRVGEKTAPPLPPRAVPEPPQVHSPHGNRKPKGEGCSGHQPRAGRAERQGGAGLERLWLRGPTRVQTPTDVFSYQHQGSSPSFGGETNSDSALHTSALSTKPQDPYGGGGQSAWPAAYMGKTHGPARRGSASACPGASGLAHALPSPVASREGAAGRCVRSGG
ncbi:hypothetical protein QTO34_012697 [Cnephaeus nilssonii]|uniref:Transducer of regulated CREB activity middle domain-containing protein n=1 Tax=Cnephaeus nilssonii TaxID=3371016 RepID=A0AA40HAR3_CNENI|nr:hypothetical protein QTO34_012697 [Eptesicus nilssonii]